MALRRAAKIRVLARDLLVRIGAAQMNWLDGRRVLSTEDFLDSSARELTQAVFPRRIKVMDEEFRAYRTEFRGRGHQVSA